MSLLRLFLFIFCGLATVRGTNPIVRVTQGQIQGKWEASYRGRSFASFEGIPYARPPVGKYRFREPQQLKPWSGVWDARNKSSACIQFTPVKNSTIGSEDCLFLNVYTQNLNAGANLPVIIFIHGGSFMIGEGAEYRPERLMDKDIVLVTVNYRVGPLGFLSTGDDVLPGNNGLKDQSFALHWVQSNIRMFGGNPDSVTLTGFSAGAASVHYHYLSPLSKGTFHRGWAFSGTALAPWAIALHPYQNAKTVADNVGCPSTGSKEMVNCLRRLPAEVLIDGQPEDWKYYLFTPFAPLVPNIEPANTRGAFLTEYPYSATIGGALKHLPLVTSQNSEEGLYPAAAYQESPDTLPEIEARWEELASTIFQYNDSLPCEQRPVVADKIKQHYLGGKPVSQKTFPQLVKALSDRHYFVGGGKLAQIHALKSKQPSYFYKYAYRTTFSGSSIYSKNLENYGVSHGDDIFLIFNLIPSGPDLPEDSKMADTLIDILYNYASTGVPKISNGPEWTKVTPGSADLDYLEILGPDSFEMKSSSDFGQKSFWDNLGLNEDQNFSFRRNTLIYWRNNICIPTLNK